MGFFISDAMAEVGAAAPQTDSSMYSLFMIAIIFIMFYFVLIRPQNKRAKEQRELINNLKKGDEVVTSGGILAKIVSIEEKYIKISPSDEVELILQKTAIISVLPKGTLKSI